jgi:hypothetical protein
VLGASFAFFKLVNELDAEVCIDIRHAFFDSRLWLWLAPREDLRLRAARHFIVTSQAGGTGFL